MAIPLEGTFEYVAVIPDLRGMVFSCEAQLQRVVNDAQGSIRSRLVGPNPVLHVEDAGPTPNPNSRNPATQRCRLRLTAAERGHASFAEASFILDRGVISALHPKDLLHMVLTPCCGRIGVSAIRSDQLIFAVGAITHIPLGRDFEARMPWDLVHEAEAVFRKRDTEFRFAWYPVEYPVEIRVSGSGRIMYRGRVNLGSFEVWVLHGLTHHMDRPGSDECVSVVRKGACPVVDANSSAIFLDSDALEVVAW